MDVVRCWNKARLNCANLGAIRSGGTVKCVMVAGQLAAWGVSECDKGASGQRWLW